MHERWCTFWCTCWPTHAARLRSHLPAMSMAWPWPGFIALYVCRFYICVCMPCIRVLRQCSLFRSNLGICPPVSAWDCRRLCGTSRQIELCFIASGVVFRLGGGYCAWKSHCQHEKKSLGCTCGLMYYRNWCIACFTHMHLPLGPSYMCLCTLDIIALFIVPVLMVHTLAFAVMYTTFG